MTPEDIAQDVEQQHRDRAIEQGRTVVPALRGQDACLRCGFANDRAADGYGVCSLCMEASS